MTTLSVQPTSDTYSGNGVTTDFSYTFMAFYGSEIIVTVDDVVLTENTDYTVSGLGDYGGGTISFVTAPASGTNNVVFTWSIDSVRYIDYSQTARFNADLVNQDFNRIWMKTQEIESDMVVNGGTVAALTITNLTVGTSAIIPSLNVASGTVWNDGTTDVLSMDASNNLTLTFAAFGITADSMVWTIGDIDFDSTGNIRIGSNNNASYIDLDKSSATSIIYADIETALAVDSGGTVRMTIAGVDYIKCNGNGVTIDENLRLNLGTGGTAGLGGGSGVIGIRNCTTAPTTNPTAGGVLYVQSGALKYRGSSGTVTTLGAA